MKIKIKRENGFVEYKTKSLLTLLETLEEIKATQEPSLAFSHGCRSSVCGSCAVRVNEKEVLACAHKVQEGDVVEPLKNMEVLKDLVVDAQNPLRTLERSGAHLQRYEEVALDYDDEKRNALQSDCILCGSCYSACPVFSVNEAFLGPFALTRVWRYVSDKREGEPKTKIDAIQQNGVWDCTLCNECTLVCPQGISPKQDIEKLRAKSSQFGYMDPSFGSFGGGFGAGFGGGFDGSPQF